MQLYPSQYIILMEHCIQSVPRQENLQEGSNMTFLFHQMRRLELGSLISMQVMLGQKFMTMWSLQSLTLLAAVAAQMEVFHT